MKTLYQPAPFPMTPELEAAIAAATPLTKIELKNLPIRLLRVDTYKDGSIVVRIVDNFRDPMSATIWSNVLRAKFEKSPSWRKVWVKKGTATVVYREVLNPDYTGRPLTYEKRTQEW